MKRFDLDCFATPSRVAWAPNQRLSVRFQVSDSLGDNSNTRMDLVKLVCSKKVHLISYASEANGTREEALRLEQWGQLNYIGFSPHLSGKIGKRRRELSYIGGGAHRILREIKSGSAPGLRGLILVLKKFWRSSTSSSDVTKNSFWRGQRQTNILTIWYQNLDETSGNNTPMCSAL